MKQITKMTLPKILAKAIRIRKKFLGYFLTDISEFKVKDNEVNRKMTLPKIRTLRALIDT